MGPFSADRSRLERHVRPRSGAVRRFALTCSVALGIAVCAVSAAPPASALDDFRNQNSLSDAETQRIREFASEHYQQMCGDDFDAAEESRAALLHALRGSPVGTFRSAFMTELRSRMNQQLGGDNLFAKVNTVLVLSEIGNASALSVLTRNIKMGDQPDWQVRLASAKAIVAVVNGPDADTLVNSLAGTARTIGGAAVRETSPDALRAEFVAIAACDNTTLPDPTRAQIYQQFRAAAERLANSTIQERLAMANAVDSAATAIFPRTLPSPAAPTGLPSAVAAEIALAYANVIVAFSQCTSATPAEMRAAAAVLMRLQSQVSRLVKSIDADADLPVYEFPEEAADWDGLGSAEFAKYANALRALVQRITGLTPVPVTP